MEDILLKQKAFFEAGNTWDTRSRRAVLQILANTVKEVCGEGKDTAAVLGQVEDLRKNLYKWTGTGRLRLLLSLFAKPGSAGPVPHGTVLIDGSSAGDAGSILAPLVSALAAGNTAVVLTPASEAGEAVRRIVDETFTDDFVATVPAGGDEETALSEQGFDFIYRCGASLPCRGREGFLAFSKLETE